MATLPAGDGNEVTVAAIRSSWDFTEIVHVTDDVANAGQMQIKAENSAGYKMIFDMSSPEFLVDMPVYLGCYRDTYLNSTGKKAKFIGDIHGRLGIC